MTHPQLRSHDVVLRDGELTLRPLTEDDWALVMHFNDDEEIGWFAEGDAWEPPELKTQQAMYRRISQQAHCFVIEAGGRPAGECWLQKMNLPRLTERWPDRDLRRIDLLIRDRAVWGRGLGSRTIRLLTEFGFTQERADAIFGCDIWDFNHRSLGAFRKAGFAEFQRLPAPAGAKGTETVDVVVWRELPGLMMPTSLLKFHAAFPRPPVNRG